MTSMFDAHAADAYERVFDNPAWRQDVHELPAVGAIYHCRLLGFDDAVIRDVWYGHPPRATLHVPEPSIATPAAVWDDDADPVARTMPMLRYQMQAGWATIRCSWDWLPDGAPAAPAAAWRTAEAEQADHTPTPRPEWLPPPTPIVDVVLLVYRLTDGSKRDLIRCDCGCDAESWTVCATRPLDGTRRRPDRIATGPFYNDLPVEAARIDPVLAGFMVDRPERVCPVCAVPGHGHHPPAAWFVPSSHGCCCGSCQHFEALISMDRWRRKREARLGGMS